MTDRKKFEAMLEALINEDHEAAKDIFHNIVVSKSREIYENLLAEEFEDEEGVEEAFGDEDDGEGDEEEEEGDDEEDSDNPFGSDDEEGDEFDPDEGDTELDGEDDFGFGGDDEEGDEFDPDEGDTELGDLEDEVYNLKDKLADLQAEFEQLLAGEENEPEHNDMFGGNDMGDDMGMDLDSEEDESFENMFEYVNKVALPKHGDNGTNTKSIFNKPKYNDMGGVAPKFAGEAKGEGTQGGLLAPKTSKMDAGNVNVPGNAKAPKYSNVAKGHGAEKKSTGDNGQNKRSVIPGRK